MLKDGFNAEKSCSCAKQSPTATDLGRSMDPSTSETDTPSSSNAPTPYGPESQAKLETDSVPPTSGTAKKCLFKLGMCLSVLIPSLGALILSQSIDIFYIYGIPAGDRIKYSCSSSGGLYQTSSSR